MLIKHLAPALLLAASPLHAEVTSSPPEQQIPVLAQGEGRQVAESLAHALETSYTDLTVGARYAAKLRASAGSGAYDQGNWKDLSEWINADLESVQRDGHLHLFATAPSNGPVFISPSEHGPHDPQTDAPRWLAPGIAYLRYHGFPGWNETNKATETFLRKYSGAKAVIFDMRDNSGGGLSEMDRLFAKLYAQPTALVRMQINRAVEERDGAMVLSDHDTLRTVPAPEGLILRDHWAIPDEPATPWRSAKVYVLTGRHTMSAAEHFALAMKRTGRAVLVGQPTRGANHFGGEVQLTEHFAAFIPVGRTYDQDTGLDWEGTGVAPDVACDEDKALKVALSLAKASLKAKP